MSFLSLVSLILLIVSIGFVVSSTKLRQFHDILIFLFLIIQSWFSFQWVYFLYNDKVLLTGSDDTLGLFLANLSLFLPLGFIYISKRRLRMKRILALITVLLISSFGTVIIHAIISSPCRFCAFSPENQKVLLNLGFQFIIDAVLLLGFAFLLFDKTYRFAKNQPVLKAIGTVFSLFYINDILILLSRMTADLNFYSMEIAMRVEIVLYLVFSIGIVYLSFLIKSRGNEVSIAKPSRYMIDFALIDSDWSILKQNIKDSELSSLAEHVDSVEGLTKNERLYMFLCHFDDISNKALSDILCVSVRTVETNKYRLRKKLESKEVEM